MRERLDALAEARHISPSELLAELVSEAETTQLVAEVNDALERLSREPVTGRGQRAQLRRLEATVAGWMED